MTTTVTFLGHGTFLVETNGTHVLIDPFLTDNPVASTTAEEVPAEVIILTHGHGDHVGDVIAVAQRTGAMVIANFEIVEWLGGQGIENTHPLHIGGQHAFEWGTVKLTIAHHGSMLPDGSWKAGGKNPRLDRYVLTVETDQPVITGFRFWALQDPGFPAK